MKLHVCTIIIINIRERDEYRRIHFRDSFHYDISIDTEEEQYYIVVFHFGCGRFFWFCFLKIDIDGLWFIK